MKPNPEKKQEAPTQPTNPPQAKRPRGRPRKSAGAQPAQAPPPSTSPPRASARTTDSGSSTSEDTLRRALAALEDPQERKHGVGEGQAAAEGSTATQHADEPTPMLSPAELVQISEAVSAAGLLLFAVVFKRELPTEQQTAFSESTRALLTTSAPGTLEAGGQALQENRELLRMLSPLGFLSGLVVHVVQKGRALRSAVEAHGAPRVVRMEQVQPVNPERLADLARPMNARPEVWTPAPGMKANQGLAPTTGKFAPPPGVEFGQKRMPRIEVHDGAGPVPHEPGR